MKKAYIIPPMEICYLKAEQMVSTSQTTQSVYTDDPQTTDKALVKGHRTYDVWDENWNE